MASNGTNGTNGDAHAAFDASSTVPLWLNGEEIKTSKTFDVTSPLDSKTCWKCSAADVSDGEDSKKVEGGCEEGLRTVSLAPVGSAETSAGEPAPELDGEDSTKVEAGCEVVAKVDPAGTMFVDVPASESAES